MRTVTSRDGTTIAFDESGEGPALILVGGLLEQRALNSETAQLAALPLLAEHFTVYHYDRRGRGDSTDTQPYAVEREIEDIEALIDEAGGSAFLSGISSGAALAMEAAIELPGKVGKLAMYEAPYNSDETSRQGWKEFRRQLEELLAAGRRGDSVGLFMMLVGMPADQLEGMRQHPMWPMWEAMAPTLAYDAAVLGEDASIPVERATSDHRQWHGAYSPPEGNGVIVRWHPNGDALHVGRRGVHFTIAEASEDGQGHQVGCYSFSLCFIHEVVQKRLVIQECPDECRDSMLTAGPIQPHYAV